MFAFEEEFEVREGGVGGVGREERAGGGSAAVGGDEGGVEFGEDVGGVDGGEGALGGTLAVYAHAGGLGAVDSTGLGLEGGGEGEEREEEE